MRACSGRGCGRRDPAHRFGKGCCVFFWRIFGEKGASSGCSTQEKPSPKANCYRCSNCGNIGGNTHESHGRSTRGSGAGHQHPDGLYAHSGRQLPYRHGQHAGHLHRVGGGRRAPLSQGEGTGMDHRGVCHAPRFHGTAEKAGRHQEGWPQCGNSAANRPCPAPGGGHDPAGRKDHHPGLRRTGS